MLLFLDVETVPSQAPTARDDARASIRPPGTYKKPESIAAWLATEGQAAAEEAYRRQSLDGGTLGEIISVAIVDDGSREFVRCRHQGESEPELIQEVFDMVDAWTRAEADKIVPGHNIDIFPFDDHHPVAHNAGFDTGFLWRRATVHSLARPRWLPGPMARPGRDFTCTMQLWAGFGKTVSLDALAKALGVPSPKSSDMDGSMVFDAWLNEKYVQIEQYNLRDAEAVRDIYFRLLGRERRAA